MPKSASVWTFGKWRGSARSRGARSPRPPSGAPRARHGEFRAAHGRTFSNHPARARGGAPEADAVPGTFARRLSLFIQRPKAIGYWYQVEVFSFQQRQAIGSVRQNRSQGQIGFAAFPRCSKNSGAAASSKEIRMSTNGKSVSKIWMHPLFERPTM